jgi:hypothetical protein
MIRVILFILIFIISNELLAQVKWIDRFEVPSGLYDPGFQMSPTENGIVSFRTISLSGLSYNKVFQYFTSDFSLNSASGLVEYPIREASDMLGYDTDGNQLYVLFRKGSALSGEKYILRIDLDTKQGYEYGVENLLDMDLVEFLVLSNQALFMGNADNRPVVQLFDLRDKNIQTFQGFYNDETQILQIKKRPELQALEVVLSRKTPYRNREVSINTYDFQGNLIQEIKVENFADRGQEILDGVLIEKEDYQRVMIGSFGVDRRDSYQGMYIMEINEFGEYEFKKYTLEDFPNFFNYLGERAKNKRDKAVISNIEKGKIPSIRNYYSVRNIQQNEDSYFIYFDQFSIKSPRGSNSLFSPTSGYRYNSWNRTGYDPNFREFTVPNTYNSPGTSVYQPTPEYQYYSAHFMKVAKTGQVIWDNASTYDGLITTYPEAFGEVAVVGDEYYHTYVRDLTIKLSYFKNGQKIFDNLGFELELADEEERIVTTNPSSIRLIHWYGRYYLISGTQKIRFLNKSGSQETREVYFIAKILVNGELYLPEQMPD